MTDKSFEMYKKEYTDALNSVSTQRMLLPELRYFLDTQYSWASGNARHKPQVTILGTAVPEELVYAAGAVPYWLTGGSLASTVWSDELVPRDTDPVSRSVLGYIHRPNGADFSGTLFIIPLVSDSMRKIAYLLKEQGRKLCLVDIPAQKRGQNSGQYYQKQMFEMIRTVSAHTGTRITKQSVVSAAVRVSKARNALKVFLDISRERTDIISPAARLLVQDSYYRTFDIESWTYHVQALTARVCALSRQYACVQSRPGVLVTGSPIVFPNYKIPFLINSVGLDLTDTVDSTALKRYLCHSGKTLRGSRDRIIRNIASAWYLSDSSSAFVSSDTLYGYISWLTQSKCIEGVVYHVLKGQIEHDFELPRFEELFARLGIPVFRLETDYQYQDIEQLRIRLEAFSEMLTQNRYKEVRKAK